MTIRILNGDVRDILPTLPENSFDCIVTSPPYWGLRDYGVAGQIGLEPTLTEYLDTMVAVCRDLRRVLKPSGTFWLNVGDSYCSTDKWGGGGNTGKQTVADDGSVPSWAVCSRKQKQEGLKPKDLCLVPNRLAQMLQEPHYTGRIRSAEDRAWLAAIVDGEGSIFGSTQPIGYPTGRGRQYFRTQAHFDVGLTVSNTSLTLLERVAQIVGYGNVREAKRGPSNRRQAYVWRITGTKAKETLREIYPYLVAKQKEARLAIACPPSGDVAQECHDGLKALHQGTIFDLDQAAPPSLYEPGWYVRSEIIWHKPNPMPESVTDRPTSSHEKVWLLTKSERYFYDAAAIAEPAIYSGLANQDASGFKDPRSFNGKHKAGYRTDKQRGHSRRHAGFNDRWDAMERAEQCSGERNARNVWTIATKPYSEAHFATFPPDLAERCIKAGCPAGGSVLDPFGGAGTTGMVADRLGRDATLIELNPAYVEITKQRLANDAGMFAQVAAE